MKALLLAGITVVGLAGVSSSQASSTSQVAGLFGTAPWQVGQCYRVFPATRDTLYTFKVLGPPVGYWVPVQSIPRSPEVPGGKPAAALWLNSTSLFAVQEWSCGD
jgi:hypothetical protein